MADDPVLRLQAQMQVLHAAFVALARQLEPRTRDAVADELENWRRMWDLTNSEADLADSPLDGSVATLTRWLTHEAHVMIASLRGANSASRRWHDESDRRLKVEALLRRRAPPLPQKPGDPE